MNENDKPSAIPALADALLNRDDLDILDALTELKPLLTGPAFDELATLCDMCPIHLQDLDSCRDDDACDITDYDVPLTACRHLR